MSLSFFVQMKTGNVTGSEGFFRCASHFDAGIPEIFQGKRAQHGRKRADFGGIEVFRYVPAGKKEWMLNLADCRSDCAI